MAMRKGQLFSLIALMMSLFFIILFSGVSRVPLDKDVEQTKAEVRSLNDVVVDLSSLVGGAADSSAFEILNFSVSYLDGITYFDDYFDSFEQCLERGSFSDANFPPGELCSQFGKNISFEKLLNDTLVLTEQLYEVNISAYDHTVSIGYTDAYSLELNVSVKINFSRIANQKRLFWSREINLTREIDFSGITDPASIGTAYERKIKFRPDNRTFSRPLFADDVETVALYVDNTYYFIDVSGLSFLERMQGQQTTNFSLDDISISKFGLATFIPHKHPVTGVQFYVDMRSMVDHHYDWGAVVQHENLRFFNAGSGINRNITIHEAYMRQGIGIDDVDTLSAVGLCDASGCQYS